MHIRCEMNGKVVLLPYLSTMCMGSYLCYVIAPVFKLDYADETVFSKVYTPDLRVVFNHECTDRLLKDLLLDDSILIIGQCNSKDPSTVRSLMGNARVNAEVRQSGPPVRERVRPW